MDADQTELLTARRYHPWLGTAGGELALFPALSDEATLQELAGETTAASGEALQREAVEVAWLLGVPFFVQVIEGSGDTIADVLGGPVASSGEGRRRLDERWHVAAARAADVVIATLTGEPAQHDFADLAQAADQAARVIRPGGTSSCWAGTPNLQAATLLQQAGEPEQALNLLRRRQPLNAAGRQWAEAVQHAHIYLFSGLPGEAVEQLFAPPLENAGQAQRLIGDSTCLVLEDAHKMQTHIDE